MTALIRNLATMTRVGAARAGLGRARRAVVAQLGDAERLRAARVHPIAVLAALRTYAAGPRRARQATVDAGARRSSTRSTRRSTLAFGNVEPTGKRCCWRSTCRARWRAATVAGVPGLTPRVASAAMALVTAATEPQHDVVAFTPGRRVRARGARRPRGRLTPLASPRQRLDDAVRAVSDLPFGGTDCALPML